MVKKTKDFSDLALKIFKEHSDFLQELKEHEQKDHEWKCDWCKRQYVSIGELKEHLKKEHGIRNFCLECGKGFDTKEELFEHEYCYMCEQCDNGYDSIEELEDHIKMEHIKNGTRNICLECGKEFKNKEELFEHEYCYICEQCDNGYDSKEELEDHIKMKHIENGTRNICLECGKEFKKQGRAV